MKGRFFNYFFLFLISTLFFVLERGEMFRRFGDEDASFGALNYVIVSLIVLAAIYIIVSRLYISRGIFLSRFCITILVIYFLTIIWSLFYPLSSRNVYGYFLVPLFMFLFMNVYTCVNKNTSAVLYTMYIVGVLLAVYYFLNYKNNIYYNIEKQSNTSYTVLYLLPIMLSVPKKWLRYVAMALVVLVVMFSLKRGGFIAVILGLVVYFYISQIKMKGRKLKIWGVLLFGVISYLIYYLTIRVNNEVLGDMLFNRMLIIEETGGGGRMSIYENIINLFVTSHPLNILFGHGWCGTERDTIYHLTAHNDFLEVLYDFGVIAFVLYFSVIIQLFKLEKKLIRNGSEFAPAFGTSVAIFLANSMVSHIWIYCQYLLIFAVFWGVVSATEINKKNIL